VATIITIFLKSTEQTSCNLNKGNHDTHYFQNLDVWVSLKTDRTTAQQTAQLEGDDNVHARQFDRIDDRTATLQKSFRI